jgi:hypothetical protein
VKKLDELACTGIANTENPNLILITETRCKEDITHAFLSIDAYELQTNFRMDRYSKREGWGTPGLREGRSAHFKRRQTGKSTAEQQFYYQRHLFEPNP